MAKNTRNSGAGQSRDSTRISESGAKSDNQNWLLSLISALLEIPIKVKERGPWTLVYAMLTGAGFYFLRYLLSNFEAHHDEIEIRLDALERVQSEHATSVTTVKSQIDGIIDELLLRLTSENNALRAEVQRDRAEEIRILRTEVREARIAGQANDLLARERIRTSTQAEAEQVETRLSGRIDNIELPKFRNLTDDLQGDIVSFRSDLDARKSEIDQILEKLLALELLKEGDSGDFAQLISLLGELKGDISKLKMSAGKMFQDIEVRYSELEERSCGRRAWKDRVKIGQAQIAFAEHIVDLQERLSDVAGVTFYFSTNVDCQMRFIYGPEEEHLTQVVSTALKQFKARTNVIHLPLFSSVLSADKQ